MLFRSAKPNIQAKVDQIQVNRAQHVGKIDVVDVKLLVIWLRLGWIDAQASSLLSSDLEAEWMLLKVLVGLLLLPKHLLYVNMTVKTRLTLTDFLLHQVRLEVRSSGVFV